MSKDDHRPCVPRPMNQEVSHPTTQYNDPNVVMYNAQDMRNGVNDTEGFSDQNWKNCAQI